MMRTELVMGAAGVSNTDEICDANASRNLSNSDRGVRNTVVAIFSAEQYHGGQKTLNTHLFGKSVCSANPDSVSL